MSCRTHRYPKRKAYGGSRGVYWCRGCDAELVPEYHDKGKSLKKRARQKAKKEIKNGQ